MIRPLGEAGGSNANGRKAAEPQYLQDPLWLIVVHCPLVSKDDYARMPNTCSNRPVMAIRRYLGIIIFCCHGVVSAETLTVSGKGQAPVPIANKKDLPAMNQRALTAAQQSAKIQEQRALLCCII